MALPVDAYPVTTKQGQQIRLDAVRIKALDYVDFTNTSGSVLDTASYEDDMVYILYATQDCVVRFDGLASATPVNSKSVLVLGGERATIMLPIGSTGFSGIGLTAAGRLYIQRITAWAGLADDVTLGNG